MIAYYFDFPDPSAHFLQITFSMDVSGRDRVVLKLPAWRPGRYQMANFAKNVRDWIPSDENDRKLPYKKITPDTWQVNTGDATKLFVRYEYFAFHLDAGSSYLDENLIYINPLNCCLYDPAMIDRPIEMYLNIPDNFQCATSLPSSGPNQFKASGTHHLFDCPLIAAPDLQHNMYRENGYKFHIWFQGVVNPHWEKLINDFKQFTREQIKVFGSFPAKEYHFFILAPPYPLYHGVEHIDSTVITLGPGYKLMNEQDYNRLLGISSHELYHAWNVKTIRPSEWMPYDYNKESPSTLGYVAEGVTTYMGDHFLLKSGVWDFEQYAQRLNLVMTRHFNNFGRFHKSVAESSFETWLDGYEQGIPHRKTSIYIKGCMCALLLDLLIRKDTGSSKGLNNVMVQLYNQFGKKEKGFTEKDYKKVVEEVAGQNYKDYFNKYLRGTEALEEPLNEALSFIGCKMESVEREYFHESRLGITINQNKVTEVAPDAPAEKGGMSREDEIIAVNGLKVNTDGSNLNDILLFLNETDTSPFHFTVFRKGALKDLKLEKDDDIYFADYKIQKVEDPSPVQKKHFKLWAGSEV